MNVNKKRQLDRIENLLNDVRQFQKTNLKNDRFFNFAVNKKKGRIDNTLKRCLRPISYLWKQRDQEEIRVTRSGIIYGLCQLDKDIASICLPFLTIFPQFILLPIN